MAPQHTTIIFENACSNKVHLCSQVSSEFLRTDERTEGVARDLGDRCKGLEEQNEELLAR